LINYTFTLLVPIVSLRGSPLAIRSPKCPCLGVTLSPLSSPVLSASIVPFDAAFLIALAGVWRGLNPPAVIFARAEAGLAVGCNGEYVDGADEARRGALGVSKPRIGIVLEESPFAAALRFSLDFLWPERALLRL